MEFAGEWSTPQRGRQEDIEHPAEQEALVLEEWYDTLEQLLSTQVLSEKFYRLYEIELPANHTIAQSRHYTIKLFENENSFVADGTTGLVTWKAAIEFVKWLTMSMREKEASPKEIESVKRSKWILELGCGCGFLAVVLTKIFSTNLVRYIATDGSLAALDKAKENVETNFQNDGGENALRSKICYERVDWQDERTKESFTQLVDGMASIYGTNQGLLIGTDILFDPVLIPDLVEIIYDFLDRQSGSVIIACTIRNEETNKSFKNELGQRSLIATTIGKWDDGEILAIMER